MRICVCQSGKKNIESGRANRRERCWQQQKRHKIKVKRKRQIIKGTKKEKEKQPAVWAPLERIAFFASRRGSNREEGREGGKSETGKQNAFS